MIAIVDYGERPSYLLFQLEKAGFKVKFTSVEAELLQAESIILPDCRDLKKAVRRLHILNLFSMLRMVNKPVIGIGYGFAMMCERLEPVAREGLGFFPFNVNRVQETEPFPEKLNCVLSAGNTGSFGSMGNAEKAETTGSTEMAENMASLPIKGIKETYDNLYFEKIFTLSTDKYSFLRLKEMPYLPVAFSKENCCGFIFNPVFSGAEGFALLTQLLKEQIK
ncbi:MAG: hypothetical protein LC102_01855 [Ignavibacteriales bacterium]|nr:MAG: hypothetical protein F9K26_04395 [Ignavibacteriaceae bacterium]MBW7873467.1 hypothetical protein [Ignavibacteria bacterium]MCZ2142158.1 hypothetical protein [Ignavibacteriales bacterium]OQY70155.1 MAG: hypothetical protein B6D45_11645 [Ignavibacteriales bacterium UTCHB3]MBV6444893.1 Imidazole glycerol phosphate synthase subunit HisH [Ignavibacteriaceae bacterium]